MDRVLSLRVEGNGNVNLLNKDLAAGFRDGHVGISATEIHSTGCIEWQSSYRGIRIRFRPSLTTPTACGRLVRWLHYDKGPRVHLRYWAEGAWRDEIWGTPRSAAKRLERLVDASGGDVNVPIAHRVKTPREADRIPSHRRVANFWTERRGELDGDEALHTLQELTHNRSSLIRFDNDQGFLIAVAGDRMSTGLRRWVSSHGGAPLSDFPDKNFSRHLHAVYSEVKARGCPTADEFDGLVKVPSHARKRYSYHRLILPFRHGNTDVLVTSSILDNSLELLS